MKKKKTKRVSAFDVILTIIMVVFCAAIILPIVHIFALSLSDWNHIMLGKVSFWPVGLTLYNFVSLLKQHDFVRAYGVTILVTVVGTLLSLSTTAMAAYALSRRKLVGNKLLTALVVIPLFFGAGMVPTFMLVYDSGLFGSLWALILLGMISSWNLLIMRSFFDAYPQENIESGYLDGLNDAGIFFRLVLPASKAALATIGLYYAVGYWNDYMNARLYLRSENLLPLQVVLEEITREIAVSCQRVSHRHERAPAIALVTAPLILIYPFIQKHFIRGVRVCFTKD